METLNLKETALATMGYLILRLAYINAVEDSPGCDTELEASCYCACLFEDVHGEIENFFTALNRESYSRARARFFEFLTNEMAEGVYFNSERLEGKGIAKKDQPEHFWKQLDGFIDSRAVSPKVKKRFRLAFEQAVKMAKA